MVALIALIGFYIFGICCYEICHGFLEPTNEKLNESQEYNNNRILWYETYHMVHEIQRSLNIQPSFIVRSSENFSEIVATFFIIFESGKEFFRKSRIGFVLFITATDARRCCIAFAFGYMPNGVFFVFKNCFILRWTVFYMVHIIWQ